ncbi:D-alanyl-lipoteichoic acid biosynthesis protein DltD [Oscillospiraceae bacterium HV4-5-C5C]|nr:D-alanyl-lipoteichoic acid biosynthesis protein DltD [Oscillospiraceae bacterium HV4-5-C5C]
MLIIAGVTYVLDQRVRHLTPVQREDLDYDLSTAKQSVALQSRLLTADTLLFMGSSELSTVGESTHPAQFYRDGADNFELLFVGHGYVQSFQHSLDLAALIGSIPNQKVVLVLSPQWFTAEHLSPEAFASVFQIDTYEAMLRNPEINETDKRRLAVRCHALLGNSGELNEQVSELDRLYLDHDASPLTAVSHQVSFAFQALQDNYNTMARLQLYTADSLKADLPQGGTRNDHGIVVLPPPGGAKPVPATGMSIADRLIWAENEGEANVTTNSFYVNDAYYKQYMEGKYESRQGENSDASYLESPEYADLQLFLDLCQSYKVEPLLISIPVNGWWYDYTGFPVAGRQAYYEKIRSIAAANEVELLDLSEHEYTPYFLRDIMHLGWKGWVYVEDGVEKFIHENS